jgi:UDPglucose--hexose-1-phosphate uridylyltransferase
MSRLRKDPIVGRWIIVSNERPKKPEDYSFEEPEDDVTPAECPFCGGNEARTPREIASFRADKTLANTGGWWVRDPQQVPGLACRRNLSAKEVVSTIG